MPSTRTYIVKAYGDPKVVLQSFSDSPLIKDGLTVVSFVVKYAASPAGSQLDPDYASGDTVVVQLDGARKILNATYKLIDATASIALTRAATTGPPGLSVSAAVTGTVDLEVFIIYSISP